MSDTRIVVENSQALDLLEASAVELAEFAQHHAVALEQLERCQAYVRAAALKRVRFELLSVVRDPDEDAAPEVVLRMVRSAGAWIELPTDFPSGHLAALLEILEERCALKRQLRRLPDAGPTPQASAAARRRA